MDLTYRFRYLLYFAAFMLVMSVCFVYAEPASPSHLLFQVAPQHSGFLNTSGAEPSFDAGMLAVAEAPSISPELLQRVMEQARPRHTFFRRSRRTPLLLAQPASTQNQSALPTVVPGQP